MTNVHINVQLNRREDKNPGTCLGVKTLPVARKTQSGPIANCNLGPAPRHAVSARETSNCARKPDRGYFLCAGRSQLRPPTAVFCGPGFWVSRTHIHHPRLWLVRTGCHGEGTRRRFCCSAVELVVYLFFVLWFENFPRRYNRKS